MNGVQIGFALENNKTTIWLRICADSSNFQFRSELNHTLTSKVNTMKQTAKLCSVCGTPNSMVARFCVSCGQSFSTIMTSEALTGGGIAQPSTYPQPVVADTYVNAIPQKPVRLQTLSFLCLIDGVVSICIGLFWLALICTAPLGIYGIIVGVFDILYALKIIPDPIKVDKQKTNTVTLLQTSAPNKNLAMMQVVNILSLNIFSFIIGMLSLSWIKERTFQEYFYTINVIPTTPNQLETSDQTTIRNIADYEHLSGILWIILGTLQTLTIVGAIAGLWNIFAGISHCKIAPHIMRREQSIPSVFEDISQLIIIGIINLFLGGFIGLLFVAFDFYIRDVVLRNRHLFNRA